MRSPTFAPAAAVVLCWMAARAAVVVSAGSATGMYLDNGVQTVRQDRMSAEERNEVEAEILTMFGVPKKPRSAPANLDGSAPQFLYDVYRSLQRDGLHERRPRTVSDVGQYDDRAVRDSDVIITLYLSDHGERCTCLIKTFFSCIIYTLVN